MSDPGEHRFRPATIRYYVDADVLGMAKILVQVRADVTYPSDPGGELFKRYREPCPITSPATPDPEWIPEVTRRRWLIITRDSNIAVNRAEIAAVRGNRARMVALAGREAIGTWAQLEVLFTQWRRIETLLDEPGPFIYSATRSTFRPVDLS